MKIVLVVPCYNEAERIKKDFFILEKEVCFIFVDDGSTDKTYALLKSFEGKNNRILKLATNKGKAEAVRLGMLEALKEWPEADWIGFWDADLATPLSQLSFMIAFANLHNKSFDGIFGARVLRLGSYIGRDSFRHILGRVFVTYCSVILGSHSYDSQCGAKIFKTCRVSTIFAKPFISRWFFDVEVIQRMSIDSMEILESPLQVWRDIEGSKIKPISDGLKAFFEIIKIRIMYGKIRNK